MSSTRHFIALLGLALPLWACGDTGGSPPDNDDSAAADDDDSSPGEDLDGDGFDTTVDCDDSNAEIHPEATELCNAIDEDCDGQSQDVEPPPAGEPISFAIIGDFGNGSAAAAAVAQLVDSWSPDFIITNGDNNYPYGSAETMEWNVGCFYSTYIGGYSGSCRPDSPVSEANRFFPSPGNHDWDTGTLDPYIDYFELPGNERYYNFRRGPVEFFALDSDPLEPDGVTATSVQAFWLQQAMEASTAPFKLVYMHHPPYSSGSHGDTTYMQWPFEEWGASLVSAGHDHTYERLRVGALTHVINGSGGIDLRDFDTWSAGSQVQDEVNHGAQRVVADNRQLTIEFISVAGGVVDQYTHRPGAVWALQSREGEAVIDRDAVWSYADQGLAPPEDWTLPSFDDSAWASGPGPLGYGEGDEGTAVGWGEFNDFRHVTTWFRHEFELETVCDLRNLRLELVRDDAAMVYLNGHEVLRSNLPAGPVEPTTIALDNLGGSADNAFVETWLDPYLLHEGPNVLAVEVHQSTPWSSDLRMELELTAFR